MSAPPARLSGFPEHTAVYRAGWWALFCHSWRCGGGYSTWDVFGTGDTRCGFCDFLYSRHPVQS